MRNLRKLIAALLLGTALTAPAPAAADPVSAIAIGGSLASLGAGTAFATSLTGTALFALKGGILAATVLAQTAVAKMTAKRAAKPGIAQEHSTTGGATPQRIIFGRTATAGHHEAPPYVHDVDYLTYILSLSDLPIDAVESVIIDGKPVAFPGTHVQNTGYGLAAAAGSDFADRAWLRVRAGTQASADAHLVATYGGHPTRPWPATAILKGVAYAVTTFRFDREIYNGFPQVRFVVRGAKLLDPRTGATAYTENPVIMVWNLLRGIAMGDGSTYGVGVPAARLPAGEWAAAITKAETEGYRCGIDFSVEDQPLDVIDTIAESCGLQLFCDGVAWHVALGAPEATTLSITDDALGDEVDTLTPWNGLLETYNGATASYPNPDSLWEASDAVPYLDPIFVAEDGGRQLVAALNFPTVWDGAQVRRLMREYVADNRRSVSHAIPLPPAALHLRPMQTLAWTSATYGYAGKLFEVVERRIDPDTLFSAVSIRERDPSDYAVNPGFDGLLPIIPDATVDEQPSTGVQGWSVQGGSVSRRPAIILGWTADQPGEAVRWQLRRSAAEPAIIASGETSVAEGGYRVVGAPEPATSYQARGRIRTNRRSTWTAWSPATTDDVRLTAEDISAEIIDAVTSAQADANEALAQAAMAAADAATSAALVDGLSGEVLDQLEELVADLEGLDTGTIQNLRGIALAGVRRGWLADPAFDDWSAGGALERWTISNLAGLIERTEGHYTSALLIDVPSGSSGARTLTASSTVADRFRSADLKAEYVVVSLLVRGASGGLANAALRPEWRIGGTWTRGPAFGVATAEGNLAAQWGIEAAGAERIQSREIVFRRPTGAADAMRVILYARYSAATEAVSLRIDYLDIRAATAAEIDAHLAQATAEAAISAMYATLVGPAGAIAAAQDTVRAEFAAADAVLQTTVTAQASGIAAMAGQISTLQSQMAGNTAAVQTAQSAATTAQASVASLSASVTAQFGSMTSSVSTLSSAVGTIEDGLAATSLVKVHAGPNGAELRLTAWDAPASSGSAVLLRADNLLLDGSVAARQLIVGDFANLVPDNQLQDWGSWLTTSSAGGSWTLNPSSSVEGSVGQVTYTTPSSGASNSTQLISGNFPVRPGKRYSYGCRLGGSGISGIQVGRPRLRWLDASGSEISIANGAVQTGIGWSQNNIATAPENAIYGQVRVQLYGTNFSAGQGLVITGPFCRAQTEAVEIRDGAITAPKIDVSNLSAISANLGTILVGTANIADLSVGTIKIANGALADDIYSSIAGPLNLNASQNEQLSGNWRVVTSLAVPRYMIGPDRIFAGFRVASGTSFPNVAGQNWVSGVDGWQLSLWRGSWRVAASPVFERESSGPNFDVHFDFSDFSFFSNTSGSATYRMAIRRLARKQDEYGGGYESTGGIQGVNVSSIIMSSRAPKK